MEISSKEAIYILEYELTKAQERFLQAKRMGKLLGEFFDNFWQYRSVRLTFAEIIAGNVRSGELYNGYTSVLARCFLINQIVTQPNLSSSLIISQFNSFRYLALSLEKTKFSWNDLTAANFNKTIKLLRDRGLKESTVYHRASALSSVLSYLNSLRHYSAGKELRFLKAYIGWSHGIENPIRKIENPTSSERAAHSAEKYKEDIHIAIASARARIVENPELEPRLGHDRIRLESLIFPLALGLRIGEIITLPVHSFDRDSQPGRAFLRVAVEKSENAQSVPIPEIWENVMGDSYAYLLEACSEARARARDIESNGFDFVLREVNAQREVRELTRSQLAQLQLLSLNPETHCFSSELTEAFNLSGKQFVVDGRYRDALIDLPKPFASRIVLWLDERFEKWDWSRFTRIKYGRGGKLSFTVPEMALAMGEKTSGNISKQKWFINELYNLFREMNEANAFFLNFATRLDIAIAFREKWSVLRILILSNRGGSQSVAVDLKKFKDILSAQYAAYLTRHFVEILPLYDDSDRIKFKAENARPGVEARLSNNLLVIWEGQFADNKALGILPRPLFRSDLYNYLSKNSSKRTIFERLDIRDSEGEIYSLNPHMIRHWVTTAMLKSGPNEILIDMWMGRKPRQGRQYDHRTLKERAESMRERYLNAGMEPEDFLGRKVKSWREKDMSDAEISTLITEKLRVVHISPWGSCSRELYTSPCKKSLMCLRGFGTGRECPSFQIDPNDQDAKLQIEKLLASYERLMQTLEPNYKNIADTIFQELNNTEPLDQHIQYVMDVIRGCKNALNAYDRFLEGNKTLE